LKEDEKIIKRLNGILYFLSKQTAMPTRERIGALKAVGLSNDEIAEMLGTTPGFVAKEASLAKKSKRVKK